MVKPVKRRTNVIVLCATKGGVGKTTLASALAVRAAEESKRVALIDLDSQPSLSGWWDRRGAAARFIGRDRSWRVDRGQPRYCGNRRSRAWNRTVGPCRRGRSQRCGQGWN